MFRQVGAVIAGTGGRTEKSLYQAKRNAAQSGHNSKGCHDSCF